MLARNDCIDRLRAAGISREDAEALRRVSMTLHRWHELECGDSNNYASWCITRGRKEGGEFIHDEDGKPFEERLIHTENKARYTAIPDRERGALKRLAAIMARYPGFAFYVQGDPRGAALYIMPPGEMASREPGWLEANYNRGIAVYK